MSLLHGVPVAQPASVVLEGEAAHAHRAAANDTGSGDQKHSASAVNSGEYGSGADQRTVGTAPSLAGMSKIRPKAGTSNTTAAPAAPTTTTTTNTRPNTRPRRIIVPQRLIQGGLETKFEPDPYGLPLHGLLTARQYTEAILAINQTLHPARANGVDTALLVTGPLLVPLAVWGVRHRGQVKKRKRLLKKAMEEFHRVYPDLLMRWNRRPASCLTIERRVVEVHGPAPGMEEFGGGISGRGGGSRVNGMAGVAGGGGGQQQSMMVGEYMEAGEEDAFV